MAGSHLVRFLVDDSTEESSASDWRDQKYAFSGFWKRCLELREGRKGEKINEDEISTSVT